MSDGNISVRDSLNAATKELEAPGGVVEPVQAAPEPVVAAPEAQTPEPTPTQEAAPEARERGPDGKFLPKDTKAEVSAEAPPAVEKTETAPLAEKEPQETEAIRIPPSLPAAVKAQFKDLAPEVRDAFVKLEDSVQTAKAEWGKKGERLNRYDEIMAPRSEKLQLQGIDEFTFIKTLVAAQDFLERDPLGGISYLARSYGVNLNQLAAQPNAPQPGPEGQQTPTVNPNLEAMLQPLVAQVQTLQQQIAQSQQSTEAEKLASARASVADFASKPENMYFENVKADVAKRLSDGSAATLADAYDQAIWASPEIRPLLLKTQATDTAKKDAEAAQRAKAASANRSAGSVTGSPAPGASAPQGPIGTVRDTLQAAMQELGAA